MELGKAPPFLIDACYCQQFVFVPVPRPWPAAQSVLETAWRTGLSAGTLRQAQRWLLGAILLLGLVCLGVWASGQWNYRRGSAFTIPVAPGRAIHMEIWPVAVLAERWSPYDWYYSFSDHDANARWIGLWYDDARTGRRKQLLTFTLPIWPLVAETGGVILVLLGLTRWHQTHGSKDERRQG